MARIKWYDYASNADVRQHCMSIERFSSLLRTSPTVVPSCFPPTGDKIHEKEPITVIRFRLKMSIWWPVVG